MTKIIISIALFMFFSHGYANTTIEKQNGLPITSLQIANDNPNMPDSWIHELYQLMKDTHELLVQEKIDYWIQGGTLLGAIRNKGLIPWDDDIDINIELSHEAAFAALIPQFNALNYHVDIVPLGYKIVCPHTYRFNEHLCAPCIDVFFTIEEGGKIYYDPTRDVDWMHRDGGPLYIRKDELYPLRAYHFGECIVLGPYNPIPFLNACFGTSWKDVAVCWNHFLTPHEDKIIYQLTEENKTPATPTGPMLNRVQKSKTIRVYGSMVGDLFHYGHMEFLKTASMLGTEVVVGLISDETATSYKRKPILSLKERVRSALGCKYVNYVIPDTPLAITEEFINLYDIDYVVHGDDFDDEKLHTYFNEPLISKKLRVINYTQGISTTNIIHRIQN